MQFTGDEDHKISLQEAAQLTKNYRESVSAGTLLSGFFGKSSLNAILSQNGCVGLRIYNARKATGELNFVLVGVDTNGNDMTGGELAEYSAGCPPFCPAPNELTG
jgi:hypothetical protein